MDETKRFLIIDQNEKHRLLLKDFVEDYFSDSCFADVLAIDSIECYSDAAIGEFDMVIFCPTAIIGNKNEFVRENFEKTRLFVVSSFANQFDLDYFIDDEWIVEKPFDIDFLLEKIKQRLSMPVLG